LFPSPSGIVEETVRRKIYLSGCRYWLALLASQKTTEHQSVQEAADQLEAIFCLSRRHITRTLTRYSGIFWDYTPGNGRYDRGHLKVYSPDGVARVLGCAVGAVTHRPLEELCETPTAYAFTNILEANRESASPLCREALHDLYGVCARSQAYHSKSLGIKETPNHRIEAVYDTLEEAQTALAGRCSSPGKFRVVERLVCESDVGRVIYQGAMLLRQIGNSRPFDIYTQSGNLVRIGDGIWVDRELRHSLRAFQSTNTPGISTYDTFGNPKGVEEEKALTAYTEEFIGALCGDGISRPIEYEGREPFCIEILGCHEGTDSDLEAKASDDPIVHVQDHEKDELIHWFTVDNFQ
jgi:hypothetical protein